MADVDGDGRADIVGVDGFGVLVSLSRNGAFTTPWRVAEGFGSADGWTAALHPRRLGDVDGDGQLELLGFAEDGVRVAELAGAAPGRTPSCGLLGIEVAVVGLARLRWRIGGGRRRR